MSQFLRAPKGVAAGRDAITVNVHAPMVAGNVVIQVSCPMSCAGECELLGGCRKAAPSAFSRVVGGLLSWALEPRARR